MEHPLLAARPADLRRDRTSVKWRVHPEDVLPLWVAEMDTAPCEPVVAAVEAAMRRGDTGYEMGDAYAAALAGYAADTWDWEIDLGATRVVTDVMIGVCEVLRLLTDPGAAVVVSTPVYDSFFGFIEDLGRRVVQAPLGEDGRLDPESLAAGFAEAAAGGGRAAYLLCNPQNPTGVAHTRAELGTVAALADEYGLRVVADEIHAPLVHAETRFVPYLSVPGGERGISVLSASKGWNLPGLKAAVAVAGPEAAADLSRLHEVHGHGASHLGAIAQIAALTDGRTWLAQLMSELDLNRRLLADLLADRMPDVRHRMPEATYLAWLDLRELGLGDDPARVFLERGRVALSQGPRFGRVGLGFARLNLATSPAIITEAVDRMAGAVS